MSRVSRIVPYPEGRSFSSQRARSEAIVIMQLSYIGHFAAGGILVRAGRELASREEDGIMWTVSS